MEKASLSYAVDAVLDVVHAVRLAGSPVHELDPANRSTPCGEHSVGHQRIRLASAWRETVLCPQLVICLFAGSSAEARFCKRAVGLLRVPSSAPDTSCFSSWGYTPAEAGRTASAAGNKQGEGRSDGRVLEATFSVVALLPSGPDETRITISAHQCLILRNAPRKMNPFWGNR